MSKYLLPGAALIMCCFAGSVATAQSPLDAEGHLVNFERDIVPILRDNCLDCHGPEDAKNDFRVDDREIMADYIDAGDAESSSLYIDYIAATGDDYKDYLMPPPAKGGPMAPAEIALIKLWLNEGAKWPDDVKILPVGATPEAAPEVAEEPEEKKGLAGRVWAFQGFFHPATVHFPVALLLFGAIFVVLGYKWPQLAHPIPFACLVCGALSSVAASMMGWSFATERGYGDWTRGLEFTVERHRWAGVAVSVASVVFALIAIKAELKKDLKLRKVWQVGLLLCASVVGLVGHIGGELTYGDLYHEAFDTLVGDEGEPAATE